MDAFPRGSRPGLRNVLPRQQAGLEVMQTVRFFKSESLIMHIPSVSVSQVRFVSGILSPTGAALSVAPGVSPGVYQ